MNISRRFIIDDLSTDGPACLPSSQDKQDETVDRPGLTERVCTPAAGRPCTSWPRHRLRSPWWRACWPGISRAGPSSQWSPDHSHQGVRLGDGLPDHAGP
jgi:hypothetical protein